MAGRIRVFTQRNGVAARVTARAAARRSPRDAVAENADPFTTAVQVTIARLQRKLGRPRHPHHPGRRVPDRRLGFAP
jgi:hypothetical protein